MNRPVPPYGRFDAPLLVIGEAGGKDEGMRGQPFVGASGWHLRRFISHAGLDPEKDVGWDNVIPWEMDKLPSSTGGLRAVIAQYYEHLESSMVRVQAKAVLLVGRAALTSGRERVRVRGLAANIPPEATNLIALSFS